MGEFTVWVSAFADAGPSLSVFICVHLWSNAISRFMRLTAAESFRNDLACGNTNAGRPSDR